MKRKIITYTVCGVVFTLALVATILLQTALWSTRAARAGLGDTITTEGNRLFRLAQRLDDALARIDAALSICVKG